MQEGPQAILQTADDFLIQRRVMKGYKNLNKDWTCKGFKFEIGKKYTHEGPIELCESGFHLHRNPFDLFKYYEFDIEKTIVVEVEFGGDIIDGEDKTVCSEIKIIKEICGEDLKKLGNLYNNTGWGNNGNWNSGDRNSGDRNSGDRNSGDRNSGDRNSGARNSGDGNSGDRNSGDRNNGDLNSGKWNSGSLNSGSRNSGDQNSGNWNSGVQNSGRWNSGNRNSGNLNSGSWNSSDFSNGFFNSKTRGEVFVFNKKTSMVEWCNAIKPQFIYFNLTEWVSETEMTEEEKDQFPTYKTLGGFLKTYSYKEAWAKAWSNATDKDKKLLYSLPNFDWDVFTEITGIEKE